ncbi:Hsp70 family protein [Niveibacterium terrae]|uniref:Hsp70 family protein n=1 Tax=Niveibacterium terrae TaxID=3373598 RepID=UPI003A8E7029
MAARYTVGIDLGTSNTVVAYAAAGSDEIALLPIEQLIAAGEIAALPLLPSVRYQAAEGELEAGDLNQPWSVSKTAVLGRYARDLGARIPGRLVVSAKSWLSHPGVDRGAAILPWGAPDGVEKISPVEASAGTLAHVHAVWNARFPDAPLEDQQLLLTVPASFDEGARALTLEAAQLAGLPSPHLIEEAQAAFHDWLFRHREHLDQELAGARLLLVCDVGGGTTDLTLIRVEAGDEGPRLTRIGVGDHLMLGGDNMDIALAHLAERKLGEDAPLPAARFSLLVQRCRVAKEALLAADAPERITVTLLGSGSALIGGARSVELERSEVEQLIVDGFLPRVAATERAVKRRSGILEFGLPYPADPAITRHLASFLARHAGVAREAQGSEAPPFPDTLLLNGGVFRAEALAQRLAEVLSDWRAGPVRVLHNTDPDVAVARGAVAHALARSSAGPVIGGGAARSYFLILDEGGRERGLCLLPHGTEEGQEVTLSGQRFSLRLGQAVRFHLASSTADTRWSPGELVEIAEDFVRLPTLTAVLPRPGGSRPVDAVVLLSAVMTEVGTLEVACVGADDPQRRWLLAFALRGEAPDEAPRHPRLADALALIARVFGEQAKPVEPREVRQLRSALERPLGNCEDWDLPLLRALFDALWAGARRRRRSAEHERVWLNLAGYCLRPGFGAPLDEWRIAQLWEIFEPGLQYVGESQNRIQWWTLWRRVAGGLSEDQQMRIMEVLVERLEPESGKRGADPVDEPIRLAATLERLPVPGRIQIGEFLLDRLSKPAEKPGTWWALGRVGSRVSFYGSAQNVVPPEVASRWLDAVLAQNWRAVEPAAFAASQIARVSGDRSRDLAPERRDEVIRRLTAIKAPPAWITMVREAVELDEADRKRSFGEGLPPGLRLIRTRT